MFVWRLYASGKLTVAYRCPCWATTLRDKVARFCCTSDRGLKQPPPNATRITVNSEQKFKIQKIQDGERPPSWKSLHRRISVKDDPIYRSNFVCWNRFGLSRIFLNLHKKTVPSLWTHSLSREWQSVALFNSCHNYHLLSSNFVFPIAGVIKFTFAISVVSGPW